MVTLKEYQAYLRVTRIIDSCDEAEIVSKLSNERNYTLMIIESEGISPTKYYSASAAAKHCGVKKQTLDYAHKHRCNRIVRKGGVKEFRLTWLQIHLSNG